VVRFTLRPLYSRGNSLLVGPWAGLDAVAKRKKCRQIFWRKRSWFIWTYFPVILPERHLVMWLRFERWNSQIQVQNVTALQMCSVIGVAYPSCKVMTLLPYLVLPNLVTDSFAQPVTVTLTFWGGGGCFELSSLSPRPQGWTRSLVRLPLALNTRTPGTFSIAECNFVSWHLTFGTSYKFLGFTNSLRTCRQLDKL
jgi:hypothetical protein